MATQKQFGCSACLIAAIERHDEATLRRLLDDQQVQYNDTVWLRIRSNFNMIDPLHNGLNFLSCVPANSHENVACEHPIISEQPLEVGNPAACAISVVMMALLFSTADFNALQILIHSGRFNFREPLVYHLQRTNSNSWSLIIVNPLGMALLLDLYKYKEEKRSFVLSHTIIDASSDLLESVFLGIAIKCPDNTAGDTDISSIRTRSLIVFICYVLRISFLCKYLCDVETTCILALIRTLIEFGVELKFPNSNDYNDNYSVFRICLYRRNWKFVGSMPVKRRHTVQEALWWLPGLASDPCKAENSIAELLRMGLLCPKERAGTYFHYLIKIIHINSKMIKDSALRVCRQLLALGFFRKSHTGSDGESNERCFLIRKMNLLCDLCKENCPICYPVPGSNTEKCPVIAQLFSEFISVPLTLLQLSRMEIRRLIGVRHFELDVNALSLPPLLRTYISGANEMLSESVFHPGLSQEK